MPCVDRYRTTRREAQRQERDLLPDYAQPRDIRCATLFDLRSSRRFGLGWMINHSRKEQGAASAGGGNGSNSGKGTEEPAAKGKYGRHGINKRAR